MSTFMMEGEGAISVDAKVVHVDFQPAFGNHISKDVVHESLECGWSIAKAEEHDCGFEEAEGGDKSCLLLV